MTYGQFLAWVVLVLLILLVLVLVMKSSSGTLAPLEVKPLSVGPAVPAELILDASPAPEVSSELVARPQIVSDKWQPKTPSETKLEKPVALQMRFDQAMS